jgi:radical SAM superfamily enzyme YgiQ (UPF0313 family)
MNILMLYPKFPVHTFWNIESALQSVTGQWATMPPLGLLTLASYLPSDFHIRLIDRNVEEETKDDWTWADVVFFSLMTAQIDDYRECVLKCRKFGKRFAVGGPFTHAFPEMASDADWVCFQEAEDIMDEFVADLRAGRRGRSYNGGAKTDLTRVKMPRFELLRGLHRYGTMPLQFSRGCPFRCEFCDIIEIYGRVSRTKNPSQILAEIEKLRGLNYRGKIFLVDDNFIGNKARAREMVDALADWGRRNGYPYSFNTEASINLADEKPLLAAMRQANFDFVFIGIETPDPKLLKTTLKFQNVPGDPLAKLNTIRQNGIHITAGFIIGFDGENREIFKVQRDFIEASAIGIAMLGLLSAVPHTQLADRLKKEGRLLDGLKPVGEQTVTGLNFVPKGTMTKREYLSHYIHLVQEVYAPRNFFRRIRPGLLRLEKGINAETAGRKLATVLPYLRERYERGFGDEVTRKLFRESLEQVRAENPAATEMFLMDSMHFLHLHRHAAYVDRSIRKYLESPSRADSLDQVVPLVAPAHA